MASRFLLWLRSATAFFLLTHLINKGQPSIVRIAEKWMKLCFLYAAEQRCSKKKETSVTDSKKKRGPVVRAFALQLGDWVRYSVEPYQRLKKMVFTATQLSAQHQR